MRYGHPLSLLVAFLGSLGASDFGTCFPSASPLGVPVRRICLSYLLRACAYSSSRTLRFPSCVPTLLKRLLGGIGISTDCPSPTPFGLGLGPDLPWADEPSPGILRLPAGRILTCLFAYSYRHYLFPLLHLFFQKGFCVVGTLPYPCSLKHAVISVSNLSPVYFRRRVTRPVSYYALFKWWLLLSQHPGCLCNPTSFST